MMIIDFHTHTFPDQIAAGALAKLSSDSHSVPFSDGTVGGLKKSMEKAGIDLSIVLPVVTNPVKASRINQNAAKANEQSAETGIFSFGGIHPETENYKEVLKEASELGLKGIKLHPDYYQVMFDDIRMKHIMDYASELGLVIITHAGHDIGLYPPCYCPVSSIVNVVNDVHPEKLVLAHMGGWQQWDDVLDKLSTENVYIDTAFSIDRIYWTSEELKKDFHMLSNEKFIEMVRAFGSDRVLFATDSPWAEQKSYVDLISSMPFTDAEKENIFSGTAKKLLNI